MMEQTIFNYHLRSTYFWELFRIRGSLLRSILWLVHDKNRRKIGTNWPIRTSCSTHFNLSAFTLNLTGTSKVSVSDNVKLLPWLPQNDILGHPKTRLFIGHAGLNGIFESTYHGVPMICSPFFGDQFVNAQIAKRAGFAEVVDFEATSEDDFVSLIRKVLTQTRWRL